MTRETLDTLIQDLIDGAITAGDLHLLECELESNPTALERYLTFTDLDVLLRAQAEMDDQLPDTARYIREVLRLERRRMFLTAVTAAAAALLILGIVLRLIFVPEKSSLMSYRFSPSSRFEIVRSAKNTDLAERNLGDGDRLELYQGCVELQMDTGVRAVLVAPASMTRRSHKEITLDEGTAWFHVAPEASGFRALTSNLEVIDLGTEFGLFAARDRAHEIHVFKGKVRATARSGFRKSETLSTGQSRSVDPVGRLVALASAPGNYIHRLPDSLPHLAWSFDELSGDRLAASGTFPSAENVTTTLRRTDPSPRLVPGRRGMALSFNGKGDYAISDWPGFAGNRPRTVSFWVRMPATGDYRALGAMVGWGNEDNNLHNAKWKIRPAQKQPGAPSVLRLSWGVTWMDGVTPLNDGQWHHIAVATTGKTLATGLPDAQLYVDGRREPVQYHGRISDGESPPADTDTITRGAVPLVIGRSLTVQRGDLSFFEGEIDQLVIFDGYLKEEEIPALMEW